MAISENKRGWSEDAEFERHFVHTPTPLIKSVEKFYELHYRIFHQQLHSDSVSE